MPTTLHPTLTSTTPEHIMTSIHNHHAPERGSEPQPGPPPIRMHWPWLAVWAFLTAFAVFEVVKHGYVDGTATEAMLLTFVAVGCFVAPDLTFLVGAGQPAPKGSLPTRAVPWYNVMHRMWIPLSLTTVVGVALAPLALIPLAGFIGGLSWMAHIALDRTAGYGLRNPDGSRDRT